jgi:hypothetical protein
MRVGRPKTFMGFTLDKRGNFNGKPLSYWEDKADELLMQCLVSAMNVDTRSLVGAIAHERLKHLAMGINPNMFAKVLMEIEVMKANMGRALASMIAEPGSRYCKKHMPKAEKRRRKKKAKENRVDPLD